jgi:hypothetical protein
VNQTFKPSGSCALQHSNSPVGVEQETAAAGSSLNSEPQDGVSDQGKDHFSASFAGVRFLMLRQARLRPFRNFLKISEGFEQNPHTTA